MAQERDPFEEALSFYGVGGGSPAPTSTPSDPFDAALQQYGVGVKPAKPEDDSGILGTARNVGAGILKIGGTALKGAAQIGDMLTGGTIDLGVGATMDEGMRAIDQMVATKKFNEQQAGFARVLADDSKGIGDMFSYLLDNPAVLVDQSITTIGSMFLPAGAGGAAAKAALAAGKSASAASKVGVATGIVAGGAQNAADTFDALKDKPLSDRYAGAAESFAVSVLVGIATGGGAEGQIAKKLAGDLKAGKVGMDKVKDFLKSVGREATQETGEEFGNVGGEIIGGNDVTEASLGKRAALSGALGGILGGGTHISFPGAPEAAPTPEPTPTPAPLALPAPAEGAPVARGEVPIPAGEGPPGVSGIVNAYATQNAADRAAAIEQARAAENARLQGLGAPSADNPNPEMVGPQPGEPTPAAPLALPAPAEGAPVLQGNVAPELEQAPFPLVGQHGTQNAVDAAAAREAARAQEEARLRGLGAPTADTIGQTAPGRTAADIPVDTANPEASIAAIAAAPVTPIDTAGAAMAGAAARAAEVAKAATKGTKGAKGRKAATAAPAQVELPGITTPGQVTPVTPRVSVPTASAPTLAAAPTTGAAPTLATPTTIGAAPAAQAAPAPSGAPMRAAPAQPAAAAAPAQPQARVPAPEHTVAPRPGSSRADVTLQNGATFEIAKRDTGWFVPAEYSSTGEAIQLGADMAASAGRAAQMTVTGSVIPAVQIEAAPAPAEAPTAAPAPQAAPQATQQVAPAAKKGKAATQAAPAPAAAPQPAAPAPAAAAQNPAAALAAALRQVADTIAPTEQAPAAKPEAAPAEEITVTAPAGTTEETLTADEKARKDQIAQEAKQREKSDRGRHDAPVKKYGNPYEAWKNSYEGATSPYPEERHLSGAPPFSGPVNVEELPEPIARKLLASTTMTGRMAVPGKLLRYTAGIIKQALDLGLPQVSFDGLGSIFTYRVGEYFAQYSYNRSGTESGLGLRLSILRAGMRGDVGISEHAVESIIHESTHHLDKGWENGHEDRHLSGRKGSRFEVMRGMQGDLALELWKAWATGSDKAFIEHFSYPLAAKISNVNAAQQKQVAAELFAQSRAMYYSRPALLKNNAPETFKAMEELHDKLSRTTNLADALNAVREVLRVPPAAVAPVAAQPVAGNAATTTRRDPDEERAGGVGDQQPGERDDGGRVTSDARGRARREFADEISTRNPTGVTATENPITSHLGVGEEALKRDRPAFEHNVELMRGFTAMPAVNGGADAQYEAIVEHLKDNLLWLYNKMKAELRPRAALWYNGANTIARELADKYGKPLRAAAAVMASLSPQRDWFQNVSLGRRVIDILQNHQRTAWSPEMEAKAAEIWVSPRNLGLLREVRGKSLGQLTELDQKAMWIRTYDEAHNPPSFPVITPEGRDGEIVLNADGSPHVRAWGSINEIGKAISVWEDPSVANISMMLGEQHKVRSFYNNIVNPESSRPHVTIDTHAVAAAHLLPVASGSREVSANFGGKPPLKKNATPAQRAAHEAMVGPKNSKIFGNVGTYPIYHEAYVRAAREVGIQPRQMQSITWEAVRGLFEAAQKRSMLAPARAIWKDFQDGRITAEQARDRIWNLAGGITDPDWVSDSGRNASSRRKGQSGDLFSDGVSRRAAGGLVEGDGGNASAVPAATIADFESNPRAALKKPGWFVITATQEALGAATDAVNEANNDRLAQELRDSGKEFYPVKGSYEGVDQGQNFLVFGTEEEALALGRKYKQESVLTNRGYIYQNGAVRPVVDDAIVGDEARQQSGFSVLPDGTAFSMQLDWENDPVVQGVGEDVESDGMRIGQEPPPLSKDGLTPEQLATLKRVGAMPDPVTFKQKWDEQRKDFFGRFRQGVLDQFDAIKMLGQNVYEQARMTKGYASGAVEAMMRWGPVFLRGNVLDVTSGKGEGLVDVLKPLGSKAEMNRFFWWVAANRANLLAAEDRENLFTADDIRNGLALNANSTKMPDREQKYKTALAGLEKLNASILNVAEESGLIDHESRAIWAKSFYVPFFRDMPEGETGAPNIKAGLVRQKAFQKLKGGKDALNADLLSNVMENWAHLADASGKNASARAALQKAATLGVATEISDQQLAATGPPKGSVWFQDGAKRRYYTVEDARLLDSLTAISQLALDVRVLSGAKRLLTQAVTVSPLFKVRNALRDALASLGLADLSMNVAQNVATGMEIMRQRTPEAEQTYASMVASGALIRFGSMEKKGFSNAHVKRLIDHGIDPDSIVTSVDALKDKFVEAFDWYNEWGDVSEGLQRAALYKQLRDKGMSHEQAAFRARDLMDFSMQGSAKAVRFLAATVPFFNARIQGLYKVGRATAENPMRMGSIVAALGVASILLMAAYHDDDDWKKRDDFDRDNYWWFKVGGKAVRIPKPFEIGMFATLIERTAELMTDDEMTRKRFMQRLGYAFSQTVPLGIDPTSKAFINPTTFMPQLVKPLVELYANVNAFTGRPIETAGMERLPKEVRGLDRASPIGAFGARVTPLSPVQIDHLVNGYLGWVGTMATTTGRLMAGRINEGPESRDALGDYLQLIKTPPPGGGRYVTMFYESAKLLEERDAYVRKLAKEGRMDEAKAILAEEPGLMSRANAARSVTRSMSQLRAMEARLRESSTLTPAEKRRRIDEIETRLGDLARRADQRLRLGE